MGKQETGGVSLDSLNAVEASGRAFEFEYVKPDGTGSGIFLQVLGGQSKEVVQAVAKIVNEGRRKRAAREINRKIGTNAKNVDFEPLETEIEFAQRLAAVRIVGWRGITQECTPENALKLCQINKFIAQQVMDQSDDITNFMNL